MSTGRMPRTPLKSPVTAREVIGRLLMTLKRVGSDEQKAEAQEIEDLLVQHFAQPEAVSFASAGEQADPEGGGKK